MKKFLAFACIILLAAVFCGCGTSNKSEEIDENYFASIVNGAGEVTNSVYIYVDHKYIENPTRLQTTYSFVEAESHTESWGSSNWITKIKKRGKLVSIDAVIEKAKEYGEDVILNEDVEFYDAYSGTSKTYKKDELVSLEDFKEALESDATQMMVHKPMIYIYPKEKTNVKVTLGNPEKLSHSYPKYDGPWEALAYTDGTLELGGRQYYGLYWEGIKGQASNFDSGFCVAGADTVAFLEEKLAILGLSEREANEFIVYWLPKMESNAYNLIRFQTKEEIDEYMPLDVAPTPDTVIRVMMEYVASNEKINLPEQQLEKAERKGFTVVEWGGIEN